MQCVIIVIFKRGLSAVGSDGDSDVGLQYKFYILAGDK